MERVEGYAEAAFNLALAEDDLGRVERELLAVAGAVEGSRELREALVDPRLPAERKQAIFGDLIGGRVSGVTAGFLSLVVAQGRAGELPVIAERLAERSAASRQNAVAEIRSAIPLDQSTVDRLVAALGKTTGRRLEARVVVDPSVLGGIVARVGDTVIDGSVRRRLETLRQIVNR